MTRVTAPLCLMLLTGCGFGTWDDSDVLFDKFQVVPASDALLMKLPGAEPLEGGIGSAIFGLGALCDGEGAKSMTCGARQIVRELNHGTTDILKLVDSITSSKPTRKDRGRRIWGPVFNTSEQRTFRFEMDLEGTAEERHFSYCLHVAAGNHSGPFADSGVKCGVDKGGFVELIHGEFTPDPDQPEGAGGVRRKGDGSVTLDFNKSFLNGLATDDARGVLTIEYRFDDATNIALTIAQGVDKESGRPTNGEYVYSLAADGSGFMGLTMFKVLDRCLLCSDADALQRFNLTARWNPERASLVEARVSTGTSALDPSYYAYECVDENNTLVARKYDWDAAGLFGNPALCAFPPSSP